MFKSNSSNGVTTGVFGFRNSGNKYRALIGQETLKKKLLKDSPDASQTSLNGPKVEYPEKTQIQSAKDVASQMTALLQEEFEFSKPRRSRKSDSSCVICVGSTGTGKSSTISKVTRRDVASGNGKDRVTFKCAKYAMKQIDIDVDQDVDDEMKDVVWVDTVGWDDADLQDDSTFKDILRFIAQEQLLRVRAIVWCILPNVRKDALLSKQARLIDMFKPKDIWNNVIIICKQSRNPEDDSQGAISAAKEFNETATLPILGYTYIDDSSLTLKQKKRFEQTVALREDFLVKTDAEVRRAVSETLKKIKKDPIQVVFRNQKCLDCGAVDDVRLMPAFCHMEKIHVHPGNIIQYHPKSTERYHDSNTVLREHTGGLYRPWYSFDLFMCKMGGERYICCQALSGQPGCNIIRSCCKKPFIEGDDPITGCKERYQCCKVNVTSKVIGCKSKYECCGRRVKSQGCQELCKKCDRPWGSEASNCFEKEHNTVKLDSLK